MIEEGGCNKVGITYGHNDDMTVILLNEGEDEDDEEFL